MYVTPRGRRRRYFPRLQRGWSTDPYQRLCHLAKFWQTVRPRDLEVLTTQTRLRQHLTVTRPHLPSLLTALAQAMEYIADGREVPLEALNNDRPNKTRVSLDVYLTDTARIEVDLSVVLKELTQLLVLLEMDATQQYRETHSDYLPRMTDTLMTDVAVFTYTLFEGLSHDVA